MFVILMVVIRMVMILMITNVLENIFPHRDYNKNGLGTDDIEQLLYVY